MKKIYLLLMLAGMIGVANAQTQTPLPDGSFEEWKKGTTYAGEEFDDLSNSFWSSLNMLSTLPPDMSTGPVTLYKDNGRTGFAPKMVSSRMTVGEKEIFLPGVVGAFTVIIDEETAHFGRPYTSFPSSLKGYMKYAPVDNDSASIFVELYKSLGNGDRKTVGRGEVIYHGTISEWTAFEVNIRRMSSETPDSASVLFVSSAAYNFDNLFDCKGAVGSTLWVDDCEFVFNTANENGTAITEAKVYPNPASEFVHFASAKDLTQAQVAIFDMAGRCLINTTLENSSVNISDLKSGMFFYQITDAGEILHQGRFIVR